LGKFDLSLSVLVVRDLKVLRSHKRMINLHKLTISAIQCLVISSIGLHF